MVDVSIKLIVLIKICLKKTFCRYYVYSSSTVPIQSGFKKMDAL